MTCAEPGAVQVIDTHAHLYDVPDVAGALEQAAEAGVSDIIMPGVDLASNRRHHELRTAFGRPRLHLALGLHPGNISPEEIEYCFPYMRAHMSGAVAVGETGLDFSYTSVRTDAGKKDEQRAVFRRHLDLALEFNLPVIVHSRGAWQECLDMVKAAGVVRADFHWYSGPEDVLKGILDAGFVMSCSPAIEYSAEVRRAALYAPLERILLETDTPVKIPGPSRARVLSTPKDVWRPLRALAALKGVDESRVLTATSTLARAFFALDRLNPGG